MVYNIKQYESSEKEGTLICHWCGCTNNRHREPEVPYFRVDGIIGCGPCWNVVKYTAMFMGVATNDTPMRELVQIMKKARKKFGKELPRCKKRKRTNEVCGATTGLRTFGCRGLMDSGGCPLGFEYGCL